MQEHYVPQAHETRLFYAKVLRWTRNDQLLVPSKKVVGQLDEAQLLSRYGITVAK